MTHLNHVQISSACWIIALLGGALTPQVAHGENLDSGCSIQAMAFSSIEAAVGVLSQCYYKPSLREDREYIAAILEANGVFKIAVQTGRRGKDEVTLRIRRKKSQKLVALWHTHGAQGFARDHFSPTDTALVNRLSVPFFLTDPAGVIKRFDPGTKVLRGNKRITGGRIPRGSATGIIIGHI